MTGIYLITNTHNGSSYVGQSSDVARRWKQHTQSLPAEPPASLIQRAFNKYGLRRQVSRPGEYEGFVFEILEECRREDLNERELSWIHKLKPQYNIALSPANPDVQPFREKTESRHIVQYHNYKNELHLPGLPPDRAECDSQPAFEYGHYISTNKRMAVRSKGDVIYLILGVKYKRGVEFFLWSTTYVEEVTFLPDEELQINVAGDQYFYRPPAHLNNIPGFKAFKTKNGNFAYGYQSIAKDHPFLQTLISISQKNLFDANPVDCKTYIDEFEAGLPEPLY